jgi:serine/threonine-protein kinase PpkA
MSDPIQVPGYNILQIIGQGGQAQVFHAEREHDGLRVALKVLDRRMKNDPVFLERFVREYKLLAALEIDHVARIYDQGFSGEHPYIAMEYLPSGTLAARIQEGLEPRAALRLTAQIARALAAIHQRGIVHRDLKPANVLFRPDGRPVLVDFGLAKDLGVVSNLTVAGHLLTTPRYMSPEQCMGKPVDERTDLYSLGVVLYEMLTGEKMFGSVTSSDLLRMHTSAPRPRLPEPHAVHQPLLERLLAIDPAARFASAMDVCATITL